MAPDDALERRLAAVERAVTESPGAVEPSDDADAVAARVESLEAALEDADERIAELEAATQALRGYAGEIRSVNESVERRADAALAAVEQLETERSPQQATGEAPAESTAAPTGAPRASDATTRQQPDTADTQPSAGVRSGGSAAQDALLGAPQPDSEAAPESEAPHSGATTGEPADSGELPESLLGRVRQVL
jgi:chromosome segregation ATPase